MEANALAGVSHTIVLPAGTYTLTIAGPNENGGAILIESSGTLKLASSTVRDSASGLSGAGIFNAGTLTLVDSTARDNISSSMAGGIHNGGVMTLVRSQVIGNTAGGGGGIFNGGGVRASVVMVDSTIEGNRAAAGDSGGGIMNNSQLTIDRSTSSRWRRWARSW